jgi:integrase
MLYLTQSQVRDALRLVPNDRDRLALLMAYCHGLRITEVCGKYRDGKPQRNKAGLILTGILVKHTEGGYLKIPRLKGSNTTLQNLINAPSDLVLDEASALRDVVRKYELGPEDRLFPKDAATYWRQFQAAGKRAGLPETLCHPHILKHSIAMQLVSRIDLKDLQVYLGHKSLASTGKYLESNDAQASAAVVKVFSTEGSNE